MQQQKKHQRITWLALEGGTLAVALAILQLPLAAPLRLMDEAKWYG